jgi:sugar lactone lactonase YvrE
MSKFIARGEYGNVYDNQGRVFLAEGRLFILDRNANEMKRIPLDERIQSLTWGGKNKDELFVTTSNALYRVKLDGME